MKVSTIGPILILTAISLFPPRMIVGDFEGGEYVPRPPTSASRTFVFGPELYRTEARYKANSFQMDADGNRYDEKLVTQYETVSARVDTGRFLCELTLVIAVWSLWAIWQGLDASVSRTPDLDDHTHKRHPDSESELI